MAEALDYRRKLERRKAMGDAVVVSMRNSCDAELKRLRAQQTQRQLRTALASALRGLYLTYSDNPALIDAIKVDADIEARKILSCGNE